MSSARGTKPISHSFPPYVTGLRLKSLPAEQHHYRWWTPVVKLSGCSAHFIIRLFNHLLQRCSPCWGLRELLCVCLACDAWTVCIEFTCMSPCRYFLSHLCCVLDAYWVSCLLIFLTWTHFRQTSVALLIAAQSYCWFCRGARQNKWKSNYVHFSFQLHAALKPVFGCTNFGRMVSVSGRLISPTLIFNLI